MINTEMKKKMLEESICFAETFFDDPTWISTWGHNYFCPDDGAVLSFNNSDMREHICPVCSKSYSDDIYDRVWVYMYRNQALLTVYKLAVIYSESKDDELLKYIYKIVDFYSTHYTEFKLHNKNDEVFDSIETMEWGCGRLMPQGLNESIAFSRMLIGLQLIKESLDKDKVKSWKVNMFDPMVDMLKPQVNKIHNIACWNLSIIGSIGMFYDDREIIDYAFTSKFNIIKQIKHGVTSDSFWFEGSIHYNYFTLESFANLSFFMRFNNKENQVLRDVIKDMCVQGYKYAFDNHLLPNPNDGWPNINLKTYSYIYALAVYVLEDAEVNYIYKQIVGGEKPRGPLPLSEPYYYDETSIEDLIFGCISESFETSIVTNGTQNFQDSNYAILKKKDLNIFLKYGHNGPSHAHPDKMNIEIVYGNEEITTDLSNTGYGVTLCNEWHRMSPSHNTVVINGKNHVSTTRSEVLSFDDDHIKVFADGVQTGEKIVRVKQLVQRLNPDEVLKELCLALNITNQEAQEIVDSNCDEIEKTVEEENNVSFTRELKVHDNVIIDEFTVKSSNSVVMDNFLHSDYKLKRNFKLKPATLDFDKNGYQHLMNVQEILTDNNIIDLEWEKNSMKFNTIVDTSKVTLYICNSYANPVTKNRQTLIMRYKGTDVVFKTKWIFQE